MTALPKRELLFDVDPLTPEPEPETERGPFSWSSLDQVPPGTVVSLQRPDRSDISFLYVTTRGNGWWVSEPDPGPLPSPEVFDIEHRGGGWPLSVQRGLRGPFVKVWWWPG